MLQILLISISAQDIRHVTILFHCQKVEHTLGAMFSWLTWDAIQGNVTESR